MLTEGTKECTRCREVKLLHEFYRNAKRADNATVWCAACMREYQRKRNAALRDLNRGIIEPDVCKRCDKLLLAGFNTGREGYCKTCTRALEKIEKATVILAKECSSCSHTKSIQEFSRNGTMLDGYMSYCKSCVKKQRLKPFKQEEKEYKIDFSE